MKKAGYKKGWFLFAPVWAKQDERDPQGCDIEHRFGPIGFLLWYPAFSLWWVNNLLLTFFDPAYVPHFPLWVEK